MTRIVLTGKKTVSISSRLAYVKPPSQRTGQRLLRSSKQLRQERNVNLKALMDVALDEVAAPVPWIPKIHHRIGLKFLLQHGCAGLFADPGMGKTSITLAAIRTLLKEKMAERVLVIAPLRPCYLVWPKEIAKWQEFNHLRLALCHGSDKNRKLNSEADIWIVNPDGLPWLIDQGVMEQFDTLVIDESTKFKHTQTKRFKLLKPYLDGFRRRWILTGTPTPNGYLDLFGQMYVLDLGAALGRFITHYRLNYFNLWYDGYSWELKEAMEVNKKTYLPFGADANDTPKDLKVCSGEEAIQHRIAPYVLRLEADAKDMPERIENVIRVALPDKAKKVYEELEEDLITLLENGHEVQAKNAAAASTKCRQIANGGLYYRDIQYDAMGFPTYVGPRQWENLHSEKVDAVGELFEELQGSPLMVAYDFEHDLDRLVSAFPKAAVMGGGTSMKDSVRIERLWNAGKLPMLLCQPQAMGHGLNLQEGPGHTIAIHSLMWDYEIYDQFVRRVWRTGQKSKHVFIHHIVATGTVDEVVYAALLQKRKGQDALLKALRDYAEKKYKVVHTANQRKSR